MQVWKLNKPEREAKWVTADRRLENPGNHSSDKLALGYLDDREPLLAE